MNADVMEYENAVIEELNSKLKIILNKNKYFAFLINKTNEGIGVIPLIDSGNIIFREKNVKADISNFVYIKNEEVKEIKITKNYTELIHGNKVLKIVFPEQKYYKKPETDWAIPKKHKLFKFQAEEYEKLCKTIGDRF